jgi:hypothetical protein
MLALFVTMLMMDGESLESLWNSMYMKFHGIHMGQFMESSWNPPFHGHSILIPWNGVSIHIEHAGKCKDLYSLLMQDLYSPLLILPRTPLESQNSATLFVEFALPLD